MKICVLSNIWEICMYIRRTNVKVGNKINPLRKPFKVCLAGKKNWLLRSPYLGWLTMCFAESIGTSKSLNWFF